MTVAELLARISSLELSEWMAFYSIEPFGTERDNLHAGVVASATVNLWRDSDDEPARPQDFLLQFGAQDDTDPAASEDLYDMMRTWAMLNEATTHGDDTEDAGRQAGR